MPANFTQEQRQMIQEKLIAVGYDLIREVGLKKMKVSMIAERADIATGTFYHFFDSKGLCKSIVGSAGPEDAGRIAANAAKDRKTHHRAGHPLVPGFFPDRE